MKRNALFVLSLLLIPGVLLAQTTLKVSSVYGPVEFRSSGAAAFRTMSSPVQVVNVGDEIRTGAGGTVMLEVPDGSYMVVSENTTITVQDYWSGSAKNLIDLVIGKVRFYIQKIGGKPNPYSVKTPTALIAVRGTIFEVTVDPGHSTEVRCLEGRVAVEATGLSDREVILDEGRKTLVRPGEYPLMPVALDQALGGNRVVHVVRKSTDEPLRSIGKDAIKPGVLARDNDRRNRTSDPLAVPGSRTNEEVRRAKPTLKYPDNN